MGISATASARRSRGARLWNLGAIWAVNIAIQLQRGEVSSLQDQLFEQLRQMILTGKLKPNSRVIATRFLADQLDVSRTTVLLAYERLISEGYLETRPAVGTFVSTTPPASPKANRQRAPATAWARPDDSHTAHGSAAVAASPSTPSVLYDFRPQAADASHELGRKVWMQAIRSVFARESVIGEACHSPAGARVLRSVIADHLAVTRGVMTSPDQVIIVGGRRQACSLISHLFLRRGDRVVVESPGDDQINDFFSARGAHLERTPVDDRGLDTARLPDGPVSLAYVTPARQCPVGGTLPAERREALLTWALASGAHLIEDDVDNELRYRGTTPPPLAATDPHGLVFYCGSFSRTLGEGFRLGYIVAPSEFVEPLLAIKRMGEGSGSWLEHAVLAKLIASGDYDHHLRRVRKIYLERRDVVVEALKARFGTVRLIGAELGASLTWVLPNTFPSATAASEAARARGVHAEPLLCDDEASAAACRLHDRALLLGYRGQTVDQLRAGVGRLADALDA